MMPMMKKIDLVGGDGVWVTGGLTKYLVYTNTIGLSILFPKVLNPTSHPFIVTFSNSQSTIFFYLLSFKDIYIYS